MSATLHMDAEQVQVILQRIDTLLAEWKEEVGHLRLLRRALFQVWDAPATADFVAQYWWILEKIENEVDGLRTNHHVAWKEFSQWCHADARLEATTRALGSLSKPIRQPPPRPEPDWSKMGPADRAFYAFLNNLFAQADVGASDEQTIWVSAEVLRKFGIDFFNLGHASLGGQIAITRTLDGKFRFQREISAELAAGLGIELPVVEGGIYRKGKTTLLEEIELNPHELDPVSTLSKPWHAVEMQWQAGDEVGGEIHLDFGKLDIGLDIDAEIEGLESVEWRVENTPDGLEEHISVVRSLKGEASGGVNIAALKGTLNLQGKSDFESQVGIEIIRHTDGSQEIEIHLYGGEGEYQKGGIDIGPVSATTQGGTHEITELSWKVEGLSVRDVNAYVEKGQLAPLFKASTGEFTREEIIRAVGKSEIKVIDQGLEMNMVSEGVDIDYLDKDWFLDKIFSNNK